MRVLTSKRLLKYNKLLLLYNKKQCKDGNISRVMFSRSQSTNSGVEHTTLSDGKKISLSTGQYARFADGSVMASIEDTSVMATVVSKTKTTNSDMLPLTVNYRQKAAAAGRIPTNFFRRELGVTENEILISRVIDRSLRPLFLKGYSYETQVICNLLAVDSINDPDIVSINAASAAISVSDIPWNGPIGAVRIGLIDNELLVNPSRREMQESILNLIVTSAPQNLVVMLEGSAKDILVPDLRKAIKMGVKECQQVITAITNLQKKYGKTKKIVTEAEEDTDVIKRVKDFCEESLRVIFTDYTHDKISRDKAVENLRLSMMENLMTENPDINVAAVGNAFRNITREIFRNLIFENNIRCDGRKLHELRNITCQAHVFKPLHGSAVFQRGQTQVLCTVTLDSLDSALKMDTITMLTSGIKEKNFFLHYEFPPYATNETGKVSSYGRREVGHGALAEKALRPIIPKDYPFTIRLTSEVLESNGSSSMASVCGGSLALMDAGVPVSSAAAGVAIGLVTKYDDTDTKHIQDYRILTDILGIEDYFGDIDFKIAGTRKGITALQCDMKVPGLPLRLIMEGIQQATVAKSQIINIMHNVMPCPRTDKSDNMPILETIEIPIHQRGKFLGVGSVNLKKIFIQTGVHIYPQDESTFSIFAPNTDAMNEAKDLIEQVLKKDREPTLEFGGIYTAKIVEIRDSGVMVTLYPNMVPTLLPTSQLDQRRIHHPSALGFEIGQEIQVKYFGRDPASGQIRISRKILQEPVSLIKSLIS